MSFSPAGDVHAVLSAPEVSQEALDKRLISQAGNIFGLADSIAQILLNFSPLNEWVLKPFMGDWQAFDRSSTAWNRAGDALEMVESNVYQVLSDVGEDWQGDAANDFRETQRTIGELLPPLTQQCRNASMLCAELVNFCTAAGDFILSVLDYLARTLMRLMAEAGVPIVGWAVIGGEVSVLVAKCFQWTSQILDMIASAVAFADQANAILTGVQNAYAQCTDILRRMNVLVQVAGKGASLIKPPKAKTPAGSSSTGGGSKTTGGTPPRSGGKSSTGGGDDSDDS
ncbi:hypothetical protein [Mycetocola spongiae]|uniref:hypothetical protein n=1 Tax=Mycetocola spongiae TaxID=2859226 RepID=UPI001CF302A6|nr:hypothetical protein [Mycetocola spongiae]UCR90371.1 hypothetical protein KXZ72_06920 [Mycetocola spongiae]